MNSTYPILEHDYASESKLEPSRLIQPRDVPEHCVISFFREVNEKVIVEKQAKGAVPNRWEYGEHPLYEIEHRGRRLLRCTQNALNRVSSLLQPFSNFLSPETWRPLKSSPTESVDPAGTVPDLCPVCRPTILS